MTVLVKDPDAALDYAIDWSIYLDAGESILESAWSVTPDGELAVAASSIAGALTQTTVGGGDTGNVYVLTNHITTSLGRTDDRSLTLRVQER